MLEPISKQLLAARGLPTVPDGTPVRVMQFGEGGFLRAFVDCIFKKLNDSGAFSGAVQVVQPIPQGLVGALRAQDYVYTLVLRGMDNGAVMDEASFIDVIKDGLDPYAEYGRFLASAASPDLRYVVSNTTEAGIVYEKTARPADVCPATFPAKVAAMLAARFDALGGAADKGLLFLPCELIEKNGDHLREAVLRHLGDWGLASTVGAWAGAHCVFYNTLVDRIVTGFPGEGAEAIWEKLGCRDDLLDVGEYFLLWVIEGPSFVADEIPFAKTGLDIIVTDNLKPYRDRKVRVLNGAHTANVLAAYLCGVDTVGDMMADPQLGAHLRAMVEEEILPGVALPDAEKLAYAKAVFERFQNPFVRHELLSISLNSVSKWVVRVLPSLKDYLAAKGVIPAKLAFSLASLIAFYRGEWRGDAFVGTRAGGGEYPIRDDKPVLDAFSAAWSGGVENPGAMVHDIMAVKALWGEDLTAIPGLESAVASGLSSILLGGMRGALGSVR
jgi:tagaturonate reductase